MYPVRFLLTRNRSVVSTAVRRRCHVLISNSSLRSSSTTYPTHCQYYNIQVFPSHSFSTNSPSDHERRNSKTESITRTAAAATTTTTTTMTEEKSFVESLPKFMRPYMYLARVDKPIGTMLLLWPCVWSTALASSSGGPDPQLLLLFTTGSFLMRGAGCTINDMWDAKYDRHVARTVTRPLASGALTHKHAAVFLGAQLMGGLAVLTSLPHLEYCFWLGAASLPLVISYPLMKRYTNWPQLVLGMTINWGALMGYAATHGSLDPYIVGPLYAGGVAWTLVYDTLYAHQDKDDDKKLGLKSTALYFGDDYTKPILHGFAAFAAANWMYAGASQVGCMMAYSHLVWQISTADLKDPDNLAQRFKSNNTVGAIMFASCILGDTLNPF